ncbi:hypothetical protein ACHAW5_001274 [Stephanodiscus triporus]|uniref:Sulfotransferase n=1 Tax=Stephanodiscus triporus TaxID=2934178 RepID=A0ABD3QLS4_9STRA
MQFVGPSSRMVISAFVALASAAALSLSWRSNHAIIISTYAANVDSRTDYDTTENIARRSLLFDGVVRLERTEYKLPRPIERNFVDWDDYDYDVDVDVAGGGALPVFWHVLKSGGTSVKLMYAQCYHLVEACETGALIDDSQLRQQLDQFPTGQSPSEVEGASYPSPWEWMQQKLLQGAGGGDDENNNERRRAGSTMETSVGGGREDAPPPSEQLQQSRTRTKRRRNENESLRVVTSEDGRKYVNVDVTTPEGIRRASELGFASSDLPDVMFTPLILETAQYLLGDARRGRMFALFRHPVNRVVSIFYYLQSATWEPTYNPAYADWTIDDYARSVHCESNWMVRTLRDKMTGPIEPEDVEIAMEILRRKCLVGLMEDMEGSVARFHSYFRFRTPYVDALGCSTRNFATKGGNEGQNRHAHPTLDPNSETYGILEQKNQLDVRLYNYAKELYAEQGEWMKRKNLI